MHKPHLERLNTLLPSDSVSRFVQRYFEKYESPLNIENLVSFQRELGIELKAPSGIEIHPICEKTFSEHTYSKRRYEEHIFFEGLLSIKKKSYHDFLNFMVWLCFPKSKTKLIWRHILDYQIDEPLTPPHTRSRTRDSLTIFDEGGIVCVCNDLKMRHELRSIRDTKMRWKIIQETPSISSLIFGHAILERIILGDKEIPGACYFILDETLSTKSDCSHIDRILAKEIGADHTFQSPKQFLSVTLS